jgi:hypothetical protein
MIVEYIFEKINYKLKLRKKKIEIKTVETFGITSA